MKPIQLSTEQGRLIRIGGLSHVGRLPASLATEMAGGALNRLAEAGFKSSTADSPAPNNSQQETVIPIEIQIKRERNDDCLGAGSGIVLWAELEGGGMIGGSALGRKNVSPEQVGEAAADDLIKGLKEGGCVDEHLQVETIDPGVDMLPTDLSNRIKSSSSWLWQLAVRASLQAQSAFTHSKYAEGLSPKLADPSLQNGDMAGRETHQSEIRRC